MARQHGKDVRVYLGERDASGDVSAISPEFTAATHDATNFGSGDYLENDPGLLGWEASLEAFYDPAAGGIGRQLESVGDSIACTSIVDGDADAIGDSAIVLGPGVVTQRSEPKNVAELMKLSASLKGNGRVGMYGKLLHVKASRTGSGNGASLDNSASSANGGRANLHVTTTTVTGGTRTVSVEHSTNEADWVNLLTFATLNADGTPQSNTQTVGGTINRYLRTVWTDLQGGSATFAVTFARY